MTTIKSFDLQTRDFQYVKSNGNGLIMDLSSFTFSNGALVVSSSGSGSGGDASSANQLIQITQAENANIAINQKLSTISQLEEISSAYLQTISSKLSGLQRMSVKYDLGAVDTIAPHQIPQFTNTPSGFNMDGWYFKNTALNQPSQAYFYSYLNPSQSIPAQQKTFLLGDITGSYCLCSILNINTSESLPRLGIYTRPLGDGNDYSPGFFRSRKVYGIPSNSPLTQGMRYLLYWGIEPDSRLYPDVFRVQLELLQTVGPAVSSESLAFLSVNTDSSSNGDVEYVLSGAGFAIGGSFLYQSEFTSQDDKQADILESITDSNVAICERLSNINVKALNNSTGVYQPITLTESPGMVSLNVHLDNQIQGYASEPTLDDIKQFVMDTQNTGFLVSVNNFPSSFEISNLPATQTVSGTVSVDNQLNTISVDNFPAEQIVSGSVNILNFPETQPISGDISVLNFPTSTEVSNKVSVFVENTSEGFDINTNITNSSLDTHLYGWCQHDSQFEKLQVDHSTHSKLLVKDNDIETELQTLNAKVITCNTNSVVITNNGLDPVLTGIRDVNLVQVADNLPTFSGGAPIGTNADSQGYTWVGAFMSFGNITNGGTIYMEYSVDGLNFGRAFDSAFVSSGFNVNAIIRLTTPSAFRYLRLFSDTVTGTNANCWFSMK